MGMLGGFMESKLATIVVESRLLVREALKSLMAKNSCRVICDIGSIAEMSGASTLSEEPKLVILGAQSVDNALTEAAKARTLWPDSKIILLYDYLSPADFQKLLTSKLNGCVPLSASPDSLISMLDMVATKDVCVMVMGDMKHPVIQPTRSEQSLQSEIRLQSAGAEPENIGVGDQEQSPMSVASLQNHHKLSETETRILKDLTKGHSNKMIARTCGIAEATVKVHMKAILRKIRLDNRTQAAIWAMENGFAAEGSNRARNAAAIAEAAIWPVATNRGPFSNIIQDTRG